MNICSRPECTRPAHAKGLCASHYNSERVSRLKRGANEANVRQCAFCNAAFAGKDRRAVYCSRECLEKARQRRRHLPVDRDRICVHCGETFQSSAPQAITCSKECSWKWQNRKSAAARRASRRNAWAARDPRCARCGEVMPTDRRIQALYCSEECKKRAAAARWRKRAPGYMRNYNYGLGDAEFTALLEVQDDKCAICRAEWSGPRDRHVDHCHDSGRVRGILCGSCNTGLGQFKDDPVRLRAAATYLERGSP